MNIYLEVYGCTANKSDAAIIKKNIRDNSHYTEVDAVSDADIIILVTCTVIGTTEQRMLHRMRLFKQMGKKVIVTGCMASVQIEKIKTILPKADIISPSLVHTILKDKEKTRKFQMEKPYANKWFGSLIAPISISEGCQYSCSYCITHLARGKLISYPEETLFRDVSDAIKQGCKEIRLTAQDTASYGNDSSSSLSLLIKNISMIQGDYRIRIGMMNPRSVKKQLDDIISAYSYEHVYHFIHLPVQSADNQILHLMNRGYTIEDCIDIIGSLRANISDITLATDIITGFPTESDEQFQHTIDFLKKIQPDVTNITRYSSRPQTKAKTMKGRIPTEIVKERSRQLSNICKHISQKKNKEMIGRKENILIIEKGKNDTVVGRTESYKPVVIKQQIELGRFMPVEIIDAKDTYLVGMLK